MPQMQHRQAKFTDYEGFVKKFKPKKTTDDCYTPQSFYDTLLAWLRDNVPAIAEASEIVRPFWPGGDYEAYDYPEGCVVVDNPPFSILAKIVDMYLLNDIKFFLFAPALTLFNILSREKVTACVVNANCTYENGAMVNTSFVTNVWPTDARAVVLGPLHRILEAENAARVKASKVQYPKYAYPPQVTSAALLGKLADKTDEVFEFPRSQCRHIRKLDCGQKVFGSGLIMGDKLTAELRAAELTAELRAAELRAAELRAAKPVIFELSESERMLCDLLNKQ